ELGHQALQQRPIRDRARDLAIDFLRDRLLEPRDVDGDDAAVAPLGEPVDEAVADLAARPPDHHDGFAHQGRESWWSTMGRPVAIEATIASAVSRRHSTAPTK